MRWTGPTAAERPLETATYWGPGIAVAFLVAPRFSHLTGCAPTLPASSATRARVAACPTPQDLMAHIHVIGEKGGAGKLLVSPLLGQCWLRADDFEILKTSGLLEPSA